jgi:hypothetical protein
MLPGDGLALFHISCLKLSGTSNLLEWTALNTPEDTSKEVSTNHMNMLTKTMFGSQRCHCRKEARTCNDRASRKMLARAVFMVTLSAHVFLLIMCIALKVERSFLFVQAVYLGTSGTMGGKGAKAAGYASAFKKAYTSGGAAQKSRFIDAGAGDLCICVEQQMWKRSSIRDWSVGIPWIGSRASGNPAFMSAREVSS